MTWFDTVINAVTRSRNPASGYVAVDGGANKGILTDPVSWMSSPPFGSIRRINYTELELYENNPFVAMAVNYLTNSVAQMEWEIIGEEGFESEIDECKKFFTGDDWTESFESGLRRLLPDLIQYDCGCFLMHFPEFAYDENKVLVNTNNKPIEMRCRDGRSFLKFVDIYGNIGRYYQYSFIHFAQAPIEYAPEEILYICAHPSSRSCYGVSKLEVIKSIADYLTAATDAQRALMENSLFPGGIISHPDVMDTEKLKRLSEMYNSSFKGEKNFSRWLTTGGSVEITPINATTIDASWIESSKFFAKVVFAIFGVPSSELGFTDTETNRATAIQQSQSFKRRGVQNLIVLLEGVFNREIVHKYFSPDIDFKFVRAQDIGDEAIRADIDAKQIASGTRTANELRVRDGLEEIEEPEEPEIDPETGMVYEDYTYESDEKTEEEKVGEKTEKSVNVGNLENKAVKNLEMWNDDKERQVLKELENLYYE